MASVLMPIQVKTADKVTYLVITAPGCEQAVSGLVKHRQNQGELVKVVKVTDIVPATNGTPAYKLIWNYLNGNHKQMGLVHVLLVGDPKDIPLAKLYPRDNIDQPESIEITGPLYSDFYYQVLDVDWDKDKDGRLGEPNDDAIVPIPSISVGRIPFSDPAIVEKNCASIIGYDSSPYRRSILQAASMYLYDREGGDPYSYFTDGSDMMEVIWNDVLHGKGFNRTTMYESEGLRPKNKPLPKYDKSLDSTNLMQYLSTTDFGMVNILAHGQSDRVNRKVWYRDEDGNGFPNGNEIKTPDLLTAEQVFGKTIRSSIVIATACSTANIAGGGASLGTAMLKQGSAAYIGATAINFFTQAWDKPDDGGNQTITYNLTKHYCDGESLGWSLARTTKEFYQAYSRDPGWAERWAQNVYSFILLGDPAMRLDPLEPKSVMPMSFNPPSLKISAGDKDETTLSFGIQSSRNPLTLSFVADEGISIIFKPPNPYPNETVTVTVSISRDMRPRKTSIEIICDSKSHIGKATIGLEVLAVKTGFTKIMFVPEYVYVQPNQEFWVDIMIKPSSPVMSMSGIITYNPALLQLVDKRLGAFSTFDYICPEWQVRDNPDKKQITFSFFRNSTKLGATSTDIAFSLCFKGKKESISDIIGLSFDVKSPDQKSHILEDVPSSRVKVHPQGLYLKVSSKPTSGNEKQVTLSGTFSPNQILTVNDQLVELASEGKFSMTQNLDRFKNEFVFKVDNVYMDVSGKIETERTLLFRKLVFWPSRKEMAFRIGSKTCWNNGSCDKLLLEPQIVSGSTMVPWRYISEQLGFTVGYEAATKKITAKKNGTTVIMTVGQKAAFINGNPVTMTVAPMVKNGTTLVPLRFVSESINAKVDWLKQYQTATVFYP
jgi:hypothetical protein